MQESAMRMMRSMDRESLVNMMMSSGMVAGGSRQQAEAMADQVRNMSDTQVSRGGMCGV
jgi:hypothetical protein